MTGYIAPIETLTLQNTNFRQVIYTAAHQQLVLMSLLPGEEIGLETHAQVDQFFRIESGQAKIIMNDEETDVGDGFVIIVPAGTAHNIINLSKDQPLKLYTIYTPPNHPDGTIHKTKSEAETAEVSGQSV